MYGGQLLTIDEPGRVRASTGLPMLEIWLSDARAAAGLVEGVPGVRSVAIYGDRLHILVERARVMDDIRDALNKKGVDVKAHRERLPSLEDVFIAMVDRK